MFKFLRFGFLLLLLLCCGTEIPGRNLPQTDDFAQTRHPSWKYAIEKEEKDHFRFRIIEGPPFIKGLSQAPVRLEQDIHQGRWLVLAFGVWGVKDRAAIDIAYNATLLFQGHIQLGIRPFWSYSDNTNWFPPSEGHFASPLWVVFQNGKVKAWKSGMLTQDEIVSWLRDSLD